jgi:hypothetical protein
LIGCVASAISDLKNLRPAGYQSMKRLTEYFSAQAMIASFFQRRWKVAEGVAGSCRPPGVSRDNYLARISAGAGAAGTVDGVFSPVD